MLKTRSLLLRIANALYRTPEESIEAVRDSTTPVKIAVIGVMALALVTVMGVRFARIFDQWNHLEAAVALDPSEFRLLLDPPKADCPDKAMSAPDCPANPANPALWKSPVKRDDPYLATRDPNAKPRPYRSDRFWIGVEIAPPALARAAAAGAHTLVLGWINSPYKVWFQGHAVADADGGHRTQPIVIPFNRDRLTSGEPIRVAIQAELDPARLVIDAFNHDRLGRDLGSSGVGLLTDPQVEAYRGVIGFWGNSRPTALALAYLLLAGVFFFFWLPARRKREYYYMALYTLVSAAFQAHRLDWIHFELPPRLADQLEIVLLFWSPVFGAFAGLAFARVRKVVFLYGVPAGLTLPILAAVFLPQGPLTELFKLVTIQTVVPGVGLVIAFTCFLQAYLLRERSKGGARNPVRAHRLLWFGAANVALSVFYFMQFGSMGAEPQRLYWLGMEHFGIALFLAAIVLSEYGESERLVSQTPVSPYHKRPVLPESVSGTLLVLDLKSSEALFRYGAQLGQGAAIVETCLSSLWTCVANEGGIVLQTEGDALRAFFDDDGVDSSLAAALRAADSAARDLSALRERLIARHMIPADAPPLAFRAGVAQGAIRPIWHQMGATRLASWMEAGSSSPFVDSTRYMDLERKVKDGPGGSVLILPETLAARLEAAAPELAAKLVARRIPLHGKHDVVYICAVFAAGTPVAAAATDAASSSASA